MAEESTEKIDVIKKIDEFEKRLVEKINLLHIEGKEVQIFRLYSQAGNAILDKAVKLYTETFNFKDEELKEELILRYFEMEIARINENPYKYSFFAFSQIEAMINYYLHKVCKKEDLESYIKTQPFITNISNSYLAKRNGQPLIDVFFDYKFKFIKREDFIQKFDLSKEEISDKKKLYEYFLFDLTGIYKELPYYNYMTFDILKNFRDCYSHGYIIGQKKLSEKPNLNESAKKYYEGMENKPLRIITNEDTRNYLTAIAIGLNHRINKSEKKVQE
jgi:hypothetical protein